MKVLQQEDSDKQSQEGCRVVKVTKYKVPIPMTAVTVARCQCQCRLQAGYTGVIDGVRLR